MAQTVIWSDESLKDIDSIAEFISRDSAHHAQRVVDEIEDEQLHILAVIHGRRLLENIEDRF